MLPPSQVCNACRSVQHLRNALIHNLRNHNRHRATRIMIVVDGPETMCPDGVSAAEGLRACESKVQWQQAYSVK